MGDAGKSYNGGRWQLVNLLNRINPSEMRFSVTAVNFTERSRIFGILFCLSTFPEESLEPNRFK